MQNLKYILIITLLYLQAKADSSKEIEIKVNDEYVEEFSSIDECKQLTYEEIGKIKINKQKTITLYIEIERRKYDDPGDFHKITISNSEGKVTNFINLSGWLNIKKSATNPTTLDNYWFNQYSLIHNPHVLVLDIGENSYVVIAFGYPYESDHGLLTIISLKNDIPVVIFNKNVELLQLVENNNSYKLRVMFNSYGYCGNEPLDKKGRMLPANPNDVSIRDIYIRNNELIVEDLKLSCEQILDLEDETRTVVIEKVPIDSFTATILNERNSDDHDRFSRLIVEDKYHKKIEYHYYPSWIIANQRLSTEFKNCYEFFSKKSQGIHVYPYFLSLDIGTENKVLLFNGFPHKDKPSLLTVVELNKDSGPRIIFNERINLLQILKTSAGKYKLRILKNASKDDDFFFVKIAKDLKDVKVLDVYAKNKQIVIEDPKLTTKKIASLQKEIDKGKRVIIGQN